jgi:hypothetical protein
MFYIEDGTCDKTWHGRLNAACRWRGTGNHQMQNI